MADRYLSLERLLWPTRIDDFIDQYFERQPFTLCRAEPEDYSDLLSLRDVESLVFSLNAPKQSNWFILVKDGLSFPMIPPIIDESEDLRPSQVVSYYYQGFTIVLNQLHKRWLPISLLCKNLEAFFNSSTPILLKGNITANLYLTPSNAQGFATHYDNQDVFILQLEGSKNWRLYGETARFPIEKLEGNLSPEQLGSPLQSVCLNAGDLLYIPRGYAHDASTTGDYSMHLTIGMKTYTWTDVIHVMSLSHDHLRSSLHFTSSEQAQKISALHEQLNDLLPLLSNDESLKSALDKLFNSDLRNLFPLPDDYFDQINQLDSINMETVMCKRHGQKYQMIAEEGQVNIQFPGNFIHLPKYVEPAVRFMIDSTNFSVGSIPGLPNDNERLIIARHMIGNGFLKVVQPH